MMPKETWCPCYQARIFINASHGFFRIRHICPARHWARAAREREVAQHCRLQLLMTSCARITSRRPNSKSGMMFAASLNRLRSPAAGDGSCLFGRLPHLIAIPPFARVIPANQQTIASLGRGVPCPADKRVGIEEPASSEWDCAVTHLRSNGLVWSRSPASPNPTPTPGFTAATRSARRMLTLLRLRTKTTKPQRTWDSTSLKQRT
ncbi:hypothetical protein QBC36DRAFT_39616 [Triangularia setosa]|uniref:Uncharacterized protein n=1 Tax=Triangularia setosa TaxID=2587417 RepID=A0AAN6WJT6_9PEZI|nr:hypothetical protein QBC36DRAFT_39616 [Podospora setosa]